MSGNSNGASRLMRMEFVFKDFNYLFTINPETYDITVPNRANIVYTKAGAFIDLFGEGINEITMTGTTGWQAGTGNREHGYEKFVELKEMFKANMNNIVDGRVVALDDLMVFLNHTDSKGYYTVPNRLRIYRNVSQPLLYKYDISLYVVKALNEGRAGTENQGIGADGILSTAGETVADRDLIEVQNSTMIAVNTNQIITRAPVQTSTFSSICSSTTTRYTSSCRSARLPSCMRNQYRLNYDGSSVSAW